MSHADFVHLHLHTEYSLLDGACRLDKLVEKAHDLKFPALAITDHGAMFGAIDFYREARDKGIKPIIGCEVYVAPGSRLDKKQGSSTRDVYHHLGLLAKDSTGYKNLVKLVTSAHVDGYYYKPRIDKDILAQHHQGLIALSGCLASEVPDLIMKDQIKKARDAVDWFKQTLGAENYFLELQNHGIPEQAKVNKHLIEFAKDFGLKLVATNDVHYIEKGHSHAHDCLVCIGTQDLLSNPKRMGAGYVPEQFYLRSADEMKARFSEVPEAVKNTLEVAEKCNLEIKFGELHYPVFNPPEHFTREGYLRQQLAEGLFRRYTIHAKAEGKEFIVTGIDDPTRLPTYSVVARASRPGDENQERAGETPAPPTPFTAFDKSRPASIYWRVLPHWQQDGATYFVTFRLADSLPQDVFKKWREQYETALREARLAAKLSDTEKQELAERIADEFAEKLEVHLDQSIGECWLRDPRVAQIVEDALRHFDGSRYWLGSYVIMPNHVHVIVRPVMEHKLPDILQAWKSFTAKEANKLLGRSGEFWQPESFDHIVRTEEQLGKFGRYVVENPGKAGLGKGEYRVGFGSAARSPESPDEEQKRAGETPAPLHEQPDIATAIKVVIDRLQLELGVIEKTGFISYFLIVADFIRHGRNKGISCVARGSAAGSIVTYLLEIANVDPIRYGLLFERFLNPERVNPPDIDIDFADDRRADVIEYVREKYGRDAVAQIVTFGTMGAKSVVRDVGRVMGLSYGECDRLAKLIPAELKMTLEKALKQVPELKEAYENEEVTRELIDTAFVLEDLSRNSSVHAAGVVIGPEPLVNLLPLKLDESGTLVTQYAMNPVGDLGLLKMDFLGLKTLTVIRNTCEMVKKTQGVTIDIDRLPLDDKKTYDLLNRAETLGVFQLESGGMRDLCKKFQISSVEHITALVALYRPGPMDLIPDFIKRRHGEIAIEYPHPLLEGISKETYGVLIYQEQVMQAAQILAGYTLGGADLLRRAMGKKKVEEMQKQREKFVKGAKEHNDIPATKANQVFDLLEKFAGYGFNKSHAAAYAIVAYQTAYLKANFPVEFYCAMMTNDMSATDKLSEYIAESRDVGIEVLGPDVNESGVYFAPAPSVVARASRPVEENQKHAGETPAPLRAIRFGMAAIKGVGEVAVEAILKARNEYGKFNSLAELCERVDGRTVNRKTLEALIKTGACDTFNQTRASLFAQIDKTLVRAASILSDKQKGQSSLFGALEEKASPVPEAISNLPEWPQHELLANEKELLGFYVTGHPLTPLAPLLQRYSLHTTSKLAEVPNRSMTRIGGMIAAASHGTSKKSGKPYCMVTLEDLDGSVQLLVMNDYEKFRPLLEVNKAILVVGEVSTGEDKPKIFPQEIMLLEDAPKKYTKQVHLRLNAAHLQPSDVERARELTAAHPGKIPLFLCLQRPDGSSVYIGAHERFGVAPSLELEQTVNHQFGEKTYYAKVDASLPEKARRAWEKKSNGAGSNGDE